MPRMRAGRRAQNFYHPLRANRGFLPGLRIADDDIGEIRAIKAIAGCRFNMDRAALLDHPVEVMASAEAGCIEKPRAEFPRRYRQISELFPAACVQQDRVREIESA